MITSEGSVDTFGTSITVVERSSLELKYPDADPKNITTFDLLAAGESFLLAQRNQDPKLATLNLFRESGQWWGQLIENDYSNSGENEVITQVYYCRLS